MFKPVHNLLLFLALLWVLAPSSTQAQVINCPSGFASTGACGVANIGSSGQSFQISGTQSGSSPALVGSRVLLLSTGANHAALSLNYQTPVADQAFTARFTFVPNGQNIAFIINNSNNNPYFNESVFSAGAGCEADFYQGFSQPEPPNSVFALELDSYSPLTASGSFTYSSAQIYRSDPYVQSPCLPAINGEQTYPKISTSPLSLNSPASSRNTSTGHTYSATVRYDGSNFTLNLYDVTAGGSCPGTTCFSHTWTNVSIPTSVDGTTAWVGLGGATNSLPGGSLYPLYINSFVYNVGTSTSTPTPKPTLKPTPTATPTPTSNSCVSIVSPANNSYVKGTAVPIKTIDRCPGVWFEALKVDQQPAGAFPTGQVIFKSTSVANGWHKLTVTSQSKNPGTVELGSASVIVGVAN